MANRVKFTPEKREQFLAALRENPNVSLAAAAIGMERCSMYRLRKEDKALRRAWADAVAEGVDKLEAEMWRRAVNGTEKPVYQQGELVGHVTEYSDSLAMFLARGLRPRKYRDRLEHANDPKNPLPAPGAVQIYLPDNGRKDGSK